MYIVATISKNSYTAEKIEDILTAGAHVLRYNFSHGTPEEVAQKIQTARDVIDKLGLKNDVKILADLPGAKMRLGAFPGGEHTVEKDQEFIFRSAAESQNCSDYVPVDVEHIGRHVTPQQIISLGDGEMAFCVTEVIDNDSFRAKALNARHIPAMKGINVGSAVDTLNHLTQSTLDHIHYLPHIRPDWVAFSFVNSADYLQNAKNLIRNLHVPDWHPRIVSKIESPLGIKNIEAITALSDIVMVARGDLGLTCPIEHLGLLQKKIVQTARNLNKEVIVATQIMDSLLSYYTPQRAEVLDLTNIILDGAHGIMFAKETGISATPERAIELAKRIIAHVEGV